MTRALNQQPKLKGPPSIQLLPYTNSPFHRVQESPKRDEQNGSTGLRLMGTIALLGTPLLVCTMHIFLQDMYKLCWEDRREYREYENIRKEWNKMAEQEMRHGQAVGRSIMDYAEKHKLPPKRHMELHALNNTLYSPSHKRLCHPAINSLRHSWNRARYEVLRTGPFKDFIVPPQFNKEAMGRVAPTVSQEAFERFADVVGYRPPSFERVQQPLNERPGSVSSATSDEYEQLTAQINCIQRALNCCYLTSSWPDPLCSCSSPSCKVEVTLQRSKRRLHDPWSKWRPL